MPEACWKSVYKLYDPLFYQTTWWYRKSYVKSEREDFSKLWTLLRGHSSTPGLGADRHLSRCNWVVKGGLSRDQLTTSFFTLRPPDCLSDLLSVISSLTSCYTLAFPSRMSQRRGFCHDGRLCGSEETTLMWPIQLIAVSFPQQLCGVIIKFQVMWISLFTLEDIWV